MTSRNSSAGSPSGSPYLCCSYASPLGAMTLAADDGGLKGLWFDGQRHFAGTLDAPMEPGDNAHLAAARAWLDEYFAGGSPDISRLSLTPIGGEFRQVVWRLLCEIPLGQVRTYGEIAAQAASRMGRERGSARAVGGAVGHNPISIIVPCHRVVGAGGNLTGYSGGIARKLWLLEREGVDCDGFRVPTRVTALVPDAS